MSIQHSPQKVAIAQSGNLLGEDSQGVVQPIVSQSLNNLFDESEEISKLKETVQNLMSECEKLKSKYNSRNNVETFAAVADVQSKSSGEIFKVSTKVPPFYPGKPDLWFCQIEAQFRNNRVTTDQTKFDIVVASLDPQYLDIVADIIRNPPSSNKYDSLKAVLIKEFAQSETNRLTLLLRGVQQGDKRPSVLLREMREISKGMITEQVLETLWSSKLSMNTRSIISTLNISLTEKAVAADKISEISVFETAETFCRSPMSTQNSVPHFPTTPADFPTDAVSPIQNVRSLQSNEVYSQIEVLTKKIDQLSATVSVIDNRTKQNKWRSRSHSRSRFSGNNRLDRSKSGQRQYEQCWYHYKFGQDAEKCENWCKYNKQSNETNEQRSFQSPHTVSKN